MVVSPQRSPSNLKRGPEAEFLLSRLALEELARRGMQRSFWAFLQRYPPKPQYIWGIHTIALIQKLQEMNDRVATGESTYMCICLPFRHGKSDIVSRRYPVWDLIGTPDDEIILASYNFELASTMSYDARACFMEAGNMYDLWVQRDRSSIGSWRIQRHYGAVHAAGLAGTITGRGANKLIIDDYCKNREDAESQTMRDKTWDSFESDLITRLAPIHGVCIVANRWHEDDLVGRIARKNDPYAPEYDSEFPKFEMVTFPAQNAQGRWLFPERFPESWYKTMRALMGAYAWGAQGQQDPAPRRGNMLRADLVQYVDEMPEGLKWRRGWDQASTEKQRMKSDPDFTVGTKAAYRDGCIYIEDVVRGQWSALKKQQRMVATAEKDGPAVQVRIETVAGYKDMYELVRAMMSGKAVVRPVTPTKDKVTNALCMEPIFEAGNVYIKKAPWNHPWLKVISAFPGGAHDDDVDSLVVALKEDIESGRRITIQSL